MTIGTLGSNCLRGRGRHGGEEPLLRLREAALRPVGRWVLPALRLALLVYPRNVKWNDLKNLSSYVAAEMKFLST